MCGALMLHPSHTRETGQSQRNFSSSSFSFSLNVDCILTLNERHRGNGSKQALDRV